MKQNRQLNEWPHGYREEFLMEETFSEEWNNAMETDWIWKLAKSDAPLGIRLTNDIAFKIVFRNERALKGLLAALLGIKQEEIESIEYLDTFMPGEYAESHKGILDIKVHLNNAKKINIELQMAKFEFWRERSLFYLSKMYLDGFLKGESYKKMEECIHIGILNFDFMENPPFYSKVELWDRKNNTIYSDKISLRVLQLNHLEQATEEERNSELYNWAKVFLTDDREVFEMYEQYDESIRTALEELDRLNADERLRYIYLHEQVKACNEATMREYYAEIMENYENQQREMKDLKTKLADYEKQKEDYERQIKSYQENGESRQEEGEVRFSRLCVKLMESGRLEELKQAAENQACKEKLYIELGL